MNNGCSASNACGVCCSALPIYDFNVKAVAIKCFVELDLSAVDAVKLRVRRANADTNRGMAVLKRRGRGVVHNADKPPAQLGNAAQFDNARAGQFVMCDDGHGVLPKNETVVVTPCWRYPNASGTSRSANARMSFNCSR